jgi:hypothetical protein
MFTTVFLLSASETYVVTNSLLFVTHALDNRSNWLLMTWRHFQVLPVLFFFKRMCVQNRFIPASSFSHMLFPSFFALLLLCDSTKTKNKHHHHHHMNLTYSQPRQPPTSVSSPTLTQTRIELSSQHPHTLRTSRSSYSYPYIHAHATVTRPLHYSTDELSLPVFAGDSEREKNGVSKPELSSTVHLELLFYRSLPHSPRCEYQRS